MLFFYLWNTFSVDHHEEALKILDEGCNFYLNKAREGVLKHASKTSAAASNADTLFRQPLFEPVVPRGSTATCYSDIMQTMEYTKRLLQINAKVSDTGKYMAVDKGIVIAELLETAFGWDSKLAAKQHKDVSDLSMINIWCIMYI